MANVDLSEINKFDEMAHRWWDLHSEFKALHEINPLRLEWIDQLANLSGKKVLDIGCGGGILAESMAKKGAHVCGIDLSDKALMVARLHLLESGQTVDYRKISAEELAEELPANFDVVTCMEMLEHVPEPQSIVAACAKLLKPGGQVFFATINRTPKAYLYAILGAEYFLKMLPVGTHDFSAFIKPSELAGWVRQAGFLPTELCGLNYNPFSKRYRLEKKVSANYFIHAIKVSD